MDSTRFQAPTFLVLVELFFVVYILYSAESSTKLATFYHEEHMLKIFFFYNFFDFFSLNSAARLQILKSVTNSTYYKDSTNLINSDLLPTL